MEYINESDRATLTDMAESMSKMTAEEKERLKTFFAGVRFAADANPKIIESLAERATT